VKFVGFSRTAVLEETQSGEVIQAAGGLVTRQNDEGQLEVVVVHRPERADWTYPKGKLEPGESLEQAALREVEEETGLVCRIGPFLGHTEYRDRRDRPKVVAYWLMEVFGGAFRTSEEVDAMRWLSLAEAAALLSYERDRELLFALDTAEEVACR
jgi:8-oxo-dGTP diphosphatase